MKLLFGGPLDGMQHEMADTPFWLDMPTDSGMARYSLTGTDEDGRQMYEFIEFVSGIDIPET